MIVAAEYSNQSKLRFWCQMVLPLVYDDSLSYMELLNKIVAYLNNTIKDVGSCETNIELLLDAFESLQDYVNKMVEDISPEIESVIDQMIEDGDFTEIITDALNSVVAPEYDEETTYLQYEYVLYEGKLYRANTTTSGEFDPTKWTEKTIAEDLTVLERYVYGLTANDVPYDNTQTYDAGSTGKAIKDLAAEVDNLDAGDVAYNSSETYNNGTVGKELGNLNTAINNKMQLIPPKIEIIPESGASHGGYIDFHYGGNTGVDYTTRIIENASGNINVSGSMSLGSPLPVASGGTGNTSVDTTPTQNSTKMVTSDGVFSAISDAQKITSYELLIHSGTTAQELGRAIMLIYGKLFLLHGIVIVTTALSQGTVIYDLPNYNYGLASSNNNPILAADNSSYTTVGVDNTNKTLKVTYNGGMQTGKFEMFLMGWIN